MRVVRNTRPLSTPSGAQFHFFISSKFKNIIENFVILALFRQMLGQRQWESCFRDLRIISKVFHITTIDIVGRGSSGNLTTNFESIYEPNIDITSTILSL